MTLVTDASEIPELALLGVKTAKCAHTGEHSSGSCQHDGSDNELESLSHEELAACLLNKSGRVPLPARFRALFALRNLADDAAVSVIGQAFVDESALLKHELAYVLGQIRNPTAIPVLNSVLADTRQDPMVRHEAGEALGAIGCVESIPVLEQYLGPEEHVAVRETCEIAIDNIRKHHQASDAERAVLEAHSEGGLMFGSVDPAPPANVSLPTTVLREQLLNPTLPLFDRYKAMFALRNQGSQEAVLALCDGLEDGSALFRHEIGYVLGQLKDPVSVPALARALSKTDEAPMVRHECAEALGSIASEDCVAILEQYISDPIDVVRESCLVALDMYEYETSDQLAFIERGEH